MKVDENWKRFVQFVKSYNSQYLTKSEREQMIKDLYLLEGGREEDFSDVLQEVKKHLEILVLRLDSSFPWKRFTDEFGRRAEGLDLAEIVARDLLLMEHTQKMYKKISDGQIDESYESDNTLDMQAFRLASYMDFENKYRNFTV